MVVQALNSRQLLIMGNGGVDDDDGGDDGDNDDDGYADDDENVDDDGDDNEYEDDTLFLVQLLKYEVRAVVRLHK